MGPSAQDPAKRAWVEGLQDDAVYVSGRARKPGEMNGKSGNLNFCAAQLYPKACGWMSSCSDSFAARDKTFLCMRDVKSAHTGSCASIADSLQAVRPASSTQGAVNQPVW